MNRLAQWQAIAALLLMSGLWGCETVIPASVAPAPAQLAVDAWLTDQPGEQQIRLTITTDFFNNAQPTPALGASVVVNDNTGRQFAFTDPDKDGLYTWTAPRDTTRIGIIGRTYGLTINYQGNTYAARSQMPRIPGIDSLTFFRDRLNPVSSEEGYRAQFFATDIPGATDYHYLRFYRNGQLQARSQDIILAYNAGFRGNADTDGLPFIRPLRQAINPEKLYAMNDTVRLEMRTLTADGYAFWDGLRAQLQNAGLFATPPTNVPTNIRNQTTGGPAAVGYFMVSPVRTRTAVVSAATLRSNGA